MEKQLFMKKVFLIVTTQHPKLTPHTLVEIPFNIEQV